MKPGSNLSGLIVSDLLERVSKRLYRLINGDAHKLQLIFYEFNFIARVSFISQQVGNDFFEYHKLSPFIFIMQLFIRFNFVTRTRQTIDEKDMNFNQPYSYAIHTQAILFFLGSTEVIKGPNVGFFFYFGIIFFLKKIYVTKKFRNPYLSMEMATSVRTLTKTNKG